MESKAQGRLCLPRRYKRISNLVQRRTFKHDKGSLPYGADIIKTIEQIDITSPVKHRVSGKVHTI